MIIIYFHNMEIFSVFRFKVDPTTTQCSSKQYLLREQQIAPGTESSGSERLDAAPARLPGDIDKACKRGVHDCNPPCARAADLVFCANSVTEVKEFFLQNNDTAP